jgi:hypothetical protein
VKRKKPRKHLFPKGGKVFFGTVPVTVARPMVR